MRGVEGGVSAGAEGLLHSLVGRAMGLYGDLVGPTRVCTVAGDC